MLSHAKRSKDLKEINNKIIAEGESLPAVQLKDGTIVQTGTVATMLHNVKLYNAGERGMIEEDLEAAVPTLIKVGLFDLFSPAEWISGDNAGRRFVAQAALKYMEQNKKVTFPRFFLI
jgi:hypothetical protein